MLFPDWLVLIFAVIGVGLCILGSPRYGISLMVPAAVRWVIWPSTLPYLSRVVPHSFSGVAFASLLIPVLLVFGGIWLLARTVSAIYGKKAGANVASEYLVRAFDGIGRVLVWIIRSAWSALYIVLRRLLG